MHNIENNMITKESIYIALVQLLETKDFDKITITDIANKAGVSRMSFYRNYDSKVNILTDRLDELFEEYYENIKNEEAYRRDFSINFFVYFKENNELISSMVKAGLQHHLHKHFLMYLDRLYPIVFNLNVEESDIQFELHYIVGGLVNVLLHWIEGGMQQSEQHMSSIVRKFSIFSNNDTR